MKATPQPLPPLTICLALPVCPANLQPDPRRHLCALANVRLSSDCRKIFGKESSTRLYLYFVWLAFDNFLINELYVDDDDDDLATILRLSYGNAKVTIDF